MNEKIKKKCGTCGSTDIRLDAWAIWVVEIQDWELSATFDEAWCEGCESTCNVEDEEIVE